MPRATPSPERKPTGLILLQIDGLSRFQFERALRARRVRFAQKLLRLRSHRLLSFYPGQPSCTPAVQAELHYGAPCATPAFSFFDRETRQEVRMYDAEWARRIAEESKSQGKGLLIGGSSYANIYTGGAERAKFCGELNTVAHWMSQLSLWRLGKLALSRPAAAWRVLGLIAAEIGIGLYDAFRGIAQRGDVFAEIAFVPARAAVAIALREAIRSEVLDDVEDGLPIIHANFFGYDEAAHRRGPHALFAHWSLRGIDRVISQIAKAARRSNKRDYQVVIFSDHGQEATVPYHEHVGVSLADMTERILEKIDEGYKLTSGSQLDAFMERARSLVPPLPGDESQSQTETRWVHLQAMGPVAHVTVDGKLTPKQKTEWAKLYCEIGKVPFALYLDEAGSVVCATADTVGSCELIKQRLKERQHEFGDETVADLEALVRSKYAGDLVLLGWRSGAKPLTFADEHGSHAGPGAEECRGFVLLPNQLASDRKSLRPVDLRQICLRLLGRSEAPAAAKDSEAGAEPAPPPAAPLRVLCYNVHGGVGSDRKRDPGRLAAVMEESKADIICFQEAFESDGDAAFSLKAAVEMAWGREAHYTFLPLHRKRGTRFGLAVASKRPFSVRKSAPFGLTDKRLAGREPRGAIWIELTDRNGESLHIANLHLGLSAAERALQAAALLGPNWLGTLSPSASLIVCGDFNAGPRGPAYLAFAKRFSDAQLIANHGEASPSFLSWAPLRRIDHIFASPHLRVPLAGVHRSSKAKRASDHLPVYADMEVEFQ